MITETQIKVFPPNSRKASLEISSVIPKKAFDALAERLGVEAGKAAEKAFRAMKNNDMDLAQLRIDDQRVRIAQVV
jgi:hypothetical protein